MGNLDEKRKNLKKFFHGEKDSERVIGYTFCVGYTGWGGQSWTKTFFFLTV
jgi:hypothetical protein